jgi:outer membrane immunogenic protein
MYRFMMVLLVGLLVLLNVPRSGWAADMPVQPASPNLPPIPYAPAAYSWTGFYIGLNVGWDWSRISDTVTTASGATGSLSGDVGGFFGGGQVGFNWQVFEPLVIGLETDFQGSPNASGSQSVKGVIGAATSTGLVNTPYFGSVRGRIGYAYGRLLFYGTGGAVYGDTSLHGPLSPGGGPFFNSADFWSWTVGAGLEAALGGPYSIKLEYLFIGSPSSWPIIPGQTGQTVTSGTNLIRAGVNYRF